MLGTEHVLGCCSRRRSREPQNLLAVESMPQRASWSRWSLLLVLFLLTVPTEALARGPDPANASILSASSTLIPVAVGTGLLLGGRGADDNVHFGVGMSSLAVGAILGPTTGQLYAGGGVDTVTALLLRTLTGGLALSGLALTLRGSDGERAPGIALSIVGGIPTAIIAIYDIADAARTAREARVRSAELRREESRRLLDVAVCGPIPCGTAVFEAGFPAN